MKNIGKGAKTSANIAEEESRARTGAIQALLLSDKSKGIFGAMNQGFSSPKDSSWILFWGSDDWLPNEKILDDREKLLSLAEKNTLQTQRNNG